MSAGEPISSNLCDGGTSHNATLYWEPAEWQTMAETLNFESASPTDKGDHTAGDTSNKIHADDIELYDTTDGWENISAYIHLTPEGNHDTDTTGITGVGFRVWDTRCSD